MHQNNTSTRQNKKYHKDIFKLKRKITTYITDKSLIALIYRELLKIKNKKTKNPLYILEILTSGPQKKKCK